MATPKADKSPLVGDKYAGIILCICEPTGSHKKSPFFYYTLEKAKVTKKEIAKYFPVGERRRPRTMAITDPPEEFFWFAKVEKSKYDN
jgi:hypothetical protein